MTPFGKRALGVIAAIALAACGEQHKVTYNRLASDADYPADETALLESALHAGTNGTSEMRAHGWALFAKLTAPARDGKGPVWETWYTRKETFGTPSVPPTRTIDRTLEIPVEFGLLTRSSGNLLRKRLVAEPGSSIVSNILFNQEAKDHIAENKLNRKTALRARVSYFEEAKLPVADWNIVPFPRRAVALKAIWSVASPDCKSRIFAWHPKDRLHNVYENWEELAVGPESCANSPQTGIDGKRLRFVPTSQFYSFTVRGEQMGQIDRKAEPQIAHAGDSIILLGLHVSTKEIPDWFWATFWWSDQPMDRNYGYDRPAAVKSVWRNYVMDVSFSMVNPREISLGGAPKICLNPYLEIGPRGTPQPVPGDVPPTSNCTTCHRPASFPYATCDFARKRGEVPVDGDCFHDNVKADFMWSISREPILPR